MMAGPFADPLATASRAPVARTSSSFVDHSGPVRMLRFAGLSAFVNGVGFGAFDLPAMWHLSHEHTVWHAGGNPTYGDGPFEAHGMSVTVPVLLAFFGTCLVLAIGGILLMVPRPVGVGFTLAGIVMCAPFWWGFNLPFARFNAAHTLLFLAVAGGRAAVRPAPPGPALGGGLRARGAVEPSRDANRAGRHRRLAGPPPRRLGRRRLGRGAGDRGRLCSLAGVDAPGTSDAVIRDRLDERANQVAAGVGLPTLGLGVAPAVVCRRTATGARPDLRR